MLPLHQHGTRSSRHWDQAWPETREERQASSWQAYVSQMRSLTILELIMVVTVF